jgi:hypothetical protein
VNFIPLEEELKKIVACPRSDITPTMATRSAPVDMAVQWRLKQRKCFVCSSSIPQNLWPCEMSGTYQRNTIYEGESNENRKNFFKFNLLNESGTQLYHFST